MRWPTYGCLSDMRHLLGAPGGRPDRRGRGTRRPGRLRDGIKDVRVAGASAEVAFERVRDLVARRFRILREQMRGGHDHPRRAVPALEAVAIPESLLQRVQMAVGRET